MNTAQDYFSLFSLPRSFDVDKSALRARYRELQGESHPDRLAAASEAEKLAAVQLSSRLNDAFATLKEPLSRAAYLLELEGVSVAEVSQSDLNMEILLEQMQLREAVAEAPEGEAGLSVLLPLKADIGARLEAGHQRFADSLEADELERAKQCFHELQFLDKLFREIEASEEQRLGY